MEFLHRKPKERETRTGQDCEFCSRLDPEFSQRRPVDRLVHSDASIGASSHLSEDGYVKHRMVELAGRLGIAKSIGNPHQRVTAA